MTRDLTPGQAALASQCARVRRGERVWPAELGLRGAGLGLLAACHWLAGLLYRLTDPAPGHSPTIGEFALAAVVVAALGSGLALTLLGPELFEHVPIPHRNPYFWRDR